MPKRKGILANNNYQDCCTFFMAAFLITVKATPGVKLALAQIHISLSLTDHYVHRFNHIRMNFRLFNRGLSGLKYKKKEGQDRNPAPFLI
jgi:hypothetical protein